MTSGAAQTPDRDPAVSGSGHDVAAMRRGYAAAGLRRADLAADPLDQFDRWLADAVAAGSGAIVEPNAMVLATVDPDGRPSARTVLLKGVDRTGPGGFVFYTNQESRKGRALGATPAAGLVFPWYAMERQVVVAGDVEVVPAADADAYFAVRPRGSQIGAWASRQSTVVADRAELEARFAAAAGRFPEPGDVPRPPYWGGYRVVPLRVEFWQGRPDRLHDRLEFSRATPQAPWSVARLSP